MLFCLVKNGNMKLQGELGFPFIWHCFANASCHMFASPLSRSKQMPLKGKPKGGRLGTARVNGGLEIQGTCFQMGVCLLKISGTEKV